ncbi:MAG: leucine-rich repeat domain-containing protein [Bacteroidales bacterium]|nr:leucine-rich repeat domain-containing protein [Bacteroidales bacterium]
MKHIFPLLAFIMLALTGAEAQTLILNNSAGQLSSIIRFPAAAKTLTLQGTLNLADFEFMALEMPALRSLDLSETVITEYNGDATFTGRTHSPADVLPAYALLGMKIENLILPRDLKAIEDGALAGTAIRQITLPATLTSIASHAFADCRNLTSVIIPAAVCEIGEGAFKGCDRLLSIKIEGTLTQIAPYTFAGCSKLNDCQIPFTVRSIGSSAFNGCTSLASVSFPANLSAIGERAFYSSGLRSVDLARTTHLTSLGNWAFADCRALAAVSLPSSLTALGTGTFFNDATLRVDALPTSATDIPDFTFAGNAGSATMLENSAVERIGAYSLAGWNDTRVFILPPSLNELKEGAMADWQRLDTIKANALTAVPGADPSTWGTLDRSTVVLLVSDNCKEMFQSADEWNEFKIMTRQDVLDGIDTPVSDDPTHNGISARLDGQNLIISSGRRIAAVQLYDVAGRSFSLPVNHTETGCTIDTSAWDVNIMIVRVVLDDATATIFKLAR